MNKNISKISAALGPSKKVAQEMLKKKHGKK